MINPLLFLYEVEEKKIQEAEISALKLTMQILKIDRPPPLLLEAPERGGVMLTSCKIRGYTTR